MKDVLKGKFVRLSAFDPEEMSKAFPRWNRNSEYFRLLHSAARPMLSPKAALQWMEKEAGEMSPASGFSLGQVQRQYAIGDVSVDMLRIDRGRQAQSPRERAIGQLADEVAVLIRLVFACNADDVFQDLNVQLIGFQARHECRQNIGVIFLTDIDSQSAFAVLGPAARHPAVVFLIRVVRLPLINLHAM